MPLKLPKSTFIWPRGTRIYVYDEDLLLEQESRDCRFDLHDNIFQTWPEDTRRAYIGIEIVSKNWPNWEEEALRWIENRIRYHFEFDGDQVRLRRHSKNIGAPCSEEFIWRVHLR